MKKISSLRFLSIFLVSLLASFGFSQKATDVLEKMIEAQGGRKVLGSIKDITFSCTVEYIEEGIGGSATIYKKEPDKYRQDGEVMEITFTKAFDGEKGWVVQPRLETLLKCLKVMHRVSGGMP